MKYLFNDSNGKQLLPDQVVKEIFDFVAAAPDRDYKISLGTDSAPLKDRRADFVTAIIIHRVGNGGRYFWRRTLINKKFHSLRARMYEEVLLSLEIARHFLEMTKLFSESDFGFEIHVDVGENGATRTMISELTSMIRASRFAFKIKPDSYAASKVADRHSKSASL